MNYDELLAKACSSIETKAEKRKREGSEAKERRNELRKAQFTDWFGLPDGKLPECKTHHIRTVARDNDVIVGHFSGVVAIPRVTNSRIPVTTRDGYGIHRSPLSTIDIALLYLPEGARLTSWTADRDAFSGTVYVSFKYVMDIDSSASSC